MPEVSISIEKLDAFKSAIARNPQKVRQETKDFLVRGLAVMRQGIGREPWRLGSAGGGAPVASGTLMRTHQQEVGDFEARIYPTAKYAPYVHQGTKFLMSRPWLDYVAEKGAPAVNELAEKLIDNVVKDLAR